MTRIEQAQRFAHEAHDSIGQKRKYSGEPYWVHTDEVATIVAEAGGTEDMVIAAHCHDILEDVAPLNPQYSAQLIMSTFGDTVMDMVIGLTDVYTKERYPNLNRKERKAMEIRRLAIEPPFTKTIKLADLLSNTKSIIANDPCFARTYIREKIALLPFLKDGDPVLYERAKVQTLAAVATLGLTVDTSML